MDDGSDLPCPLSLPPNPSCALNVKFLANGSCRRFRFGAFPTMERLRCSVGKELQPTWDPEDFEFYYGDGDDWVALRSDLDMAALFGDVVAGRVERLTICYKNSKPSPSHRTSPAAAARRVSPPTVSHNLYR